MEDEDSLDQFEVLEMNVGDAESVDISVMFNHKHIVLSLFASSSSQPGHDQQETNTEDLLIGLLNKVIVADDDDDYDLIIGQVSDLILDVGTASFREIAPALAEQNVDQDRDLHSHLYKEIFNYRLQTIEGKPHVFPISPDEAVSVPFKASETPDMIELQLIAELPKYTTKDIIVQEVYTSGSTIACKVRVGSKTMTCKADREGLANPKFEKELKDMQTITRTSSRATIRIPRMLAYVTHADTGDIIGLLRNWVPNSSLGGDLWDIAISAVPVETRRTWGTQIGETIWELHNIGVVWGNVNAANVVIDENEDAWLVGFGGGWTNGWVDKDKTSTEQGDNQGLSSIVEYLELE
ncbi:hypothetical protein FSARC_2107 [Fusarium sarcochroum]|uniref:Protein kinase domain-containing protein n=1 Tax=Fusarium sarcochroum TaxID=1208366 RepID=A0A8H4U7L5_9HYPO|nr:hypothetical protein FSARC_2107 [Fusarium sarcochroum]